jgi:hypothetical protein
VREEEATGNGGFGTEEDDCGGFPQELQPQPEQLLPSETMAPLSSIYLFPLHERREEGTTTTAPPERKVSAAQTEAAVPVVTVVLAVQETETELERDEEERKFDVANVLCDRIF